MKIAVLGAGGFLGSYITRFLVSKKYHVIPLTRKDFDLTDYTPVRKWLEQNKPDVVINCATAGGKQRINDMSLNDIQNNLSIFLNFYNNSSLFKKFINIGSGSEFDKKQNLDKVSEINIFNARPTDSYGYSKNLISRMCINNEKFYTLRLFGCFDISEPDFRLFAKVKNSNSIDINDMYFDYFSARDFCTVLDYYLNNNALFRDINCVYQEKYKLSDLVSKLISIHQLKTAVNIVGQNSNNYTGDGYKLNELRLPLQGLDAGIEEYK